MIGHIPWMGVAHGWMLYYYNIYWTFLAPIPYIKDVYDAKIRLSHYFECMAGIDWGA